MRERGPRSRCSAKAVGGEGLAEYQKGTLLRNAGRELSYTSEDVGEVAHQAPNIFASRWTISAVDTFMPRSLPRSTKRVPQRFSFPTSDRGQFIFPRTTDPIGTANANLFARSLAGQTAPLRWCRPRSVDEHAPERRHRLIPDRFGHDLDADRRLLQLVGGQAHPDIRQQIGGRTPQLVLKMTREGSPRHAAQVSEIDQIPVSRRITEHSCNSRCKSRITRQRQQSFWS